jgi:hypothetical protein
VREREGWPRAERSWERTERSGPSETGLDGKDRGIADDANVRQLVEGRMIGL